MTEEPNNIIDLTPYLDAAREREHRDQMVEAIMARAEANSNKPEDSGLLIADPNAYKPINVGPEPKKDEPIFVTLPCGCHGHRGWRCPVHDAP